MKKAAMFISKFTSLFALVAISFSFAGLSAFAQDTGPLMMAKFDYDLTLDDGRSISVFLWNESTSPFLDITQSQLPKEVTIPIRDWEHGVASEIPEYNQVPLKFLFGSYHDGAMRIRNPGNSYYDRPVKLSNKKSVNPRFYFIHPEKSYQRAFRTDALEGIYPLVQSAERMVESRKTGRAFRLFRLMTSARIPVFTGISTVSGNEAVEWKSWQQKLIDGKLLLEDAMVNMIRAYSNPALATNDPTSGSAIGRQEGDLKKKKLEEMAYDIDNVLNRRVDRLNPGKPRPNVYLFVDDDIETMKKARELFEAKVKALKDYDSKLNVARAPIRLILWNLAPKHQYESLPNVFRESKQALAKNPADLAEVMIFDSSFRYNAGLAPVQKYNPTGAADAFILSKIFEVSESLAEKALSGKADCNVILGGGL